MKKELDEDESLRLVLKQQSSLCEAYCNAQTRLQNALIDGHSHPHSQLLLHQTLTELSDCTASVQENFKLLSTMQLNDRNKQAALETHVQRSKRVLETLFESGGKLDSLGIPVSKDDVEMKTVALATLRASIAQVEKTLSV